MASTPIEVKLFAGASANPGLIALLGSAPFRWYSTQLTAGSAYPAIVAHQVSGPTLYTLGGRNPMSKPRVQFTIWEGYTPDTGNSVLSALRAFMDGFDAAGTGYPNNQIANLTDGLYAETQPGVYQTIIDYYIWNNDQQ
jgi:hypothetical protein